MLDTFRECAVEKIKELMQRPELTIRERCAKLYTYLITEAKASQIKLQVEGSISIEGEAFHVLITPVAVKRNQGSEQQRLIFTHKDGEVTIA